MSPQWSRATVQTWELPIANPEKPSQGSTEMSQVIADISMSVDGFVAEPDDKIDELIGWMFNGEVATPTAVEGFAFHTSEASAGVLRWAVESVGALISGRRNFDLASGWGGTHPMHVPVFVVTHDPPKDWPEGTSMYFVPDVDTAVEQAKAAAGDKVVGVATPNMTQQLLDKGLLDGIHVSVVPILLGKGVPFFANLENTPVHLELTDVVEGDGVTHFSYDVKISATTDGATGADATPTERATRADS
jgi:dihydrofolate reductase